MQFPGGNKVEQHQISYPSNLIPYEKKFSEIVETSDVDLNEPDDFFLALIPERSFGDNYQSEISLKEQLLNSVRHLIEDDVTVRPRRDFLDDFPEEDETRSLDPEFLESVIKDEGHVISEECDDYCTYIKKIEEDSHELENHLRALRLVESSPEVQARPRPFRKPKFKKTYADESYIAKFLKQNEVKRFNFHRFDMSQSSTSESESKDSSLEDFILKLNESDEENLIPIGENPEVSYQSQEGDKEHSRSLDDLFSKGVARDRSFSGLFTGGEDTTRSPPTQNFGISRLLIDGKDVHTFSRSVLDLTKIGLPELPKNIFVDIPEKTEEDLAFTPERPKAEIKLLVKTVDSGKSEIEIRSISKPFDQMETQPKLELDISDQVFLDRRCSEVFGRRADASPYTDDIRLDGKPPIPVSLTQSLQSLDNKKGPKNHSYRNYDQLQSTQCLFENQGLPPTVGQKSTSLKKPPSDPGKGAIPRARGFNFQVRDRPLDDSVSLTTTSAINRIFVRTPYEREIKDLGEPKKLKSILKKPPNFRPMFESVSLTSMNTQSNTMKRDSFIKSSLEKSRSCGNVTSDEQQRSGSLDSFISKPIDLKIKPFEEKKSPLEPSLHRTNSWNKYVVPTSPLSQNRSISSNSLTDTQTDPESLRIATTINPPATLIRYVTTTQCSPTSSPQPKPYVDYYDWSKQELSEDEINLSEFECPNIQSSDSEFQDEAFGYFQNKSD